MKCTWAVCYTLPYVHTHEYAFLHVVLYHFYITKEAFGVNRDIIRSGSGANLHACLCTIVLCSQTANFPPSLRCHWSATAKGSPFEVYLLNQDYTHYLHSCPHVHGYTHASIQVQTVRVYVMFCNCSQDPSKKFGATIGSLSGGRVGITVMSAETLSIATVIAIR